MSKQNFVPRRPKLETAAITKLWFDAAGKCLYAFGSTVPVAGTADFAPGCEFIDTTNGQKYVNSATVSTSCAFVLEPQVLELAFKIELHASKTIHNLFNAPVGYTVTKISYCVDVAQAITATLVKSTVNATPSSGTTPLHIAGAINCNTTIHNGTIVTLTLTTADLVLAATNKISLVLSAALTTGSLSVQVSLKRN